MFDRPPGIYWFDSTEKQFKGFHVIRWSAKNLRHQALHEFEVSVLCDYQGGEQDKAEKYNDGYNSASYFSRVVEYGHDVWMRHDYLWNLWVDEVWVSIYDGCPPDLAQQMYLPNLLA